jgi:hypothetical protein
MLSFEKDPDSPRYLWLGGHDTVTPEDIKTLVECYKETGYTVRCNHKKGHQDPIQHKFLGNHVWFMTKDDENWLMLAYHYGRSQWFVESMYAPGDTFRSPRHHHLSEPGMASVSDSYLVE